MDNLCNDWLDSMRYHFPIWSPVTPKWFDNQINKYRTELINNITVKENKMKNPANLLKSGHLVKMDGIDNYGLVVHREETGDLHIIYRDMHVNNDFYVGPELPMEILEIWEGVNPCHYLDYIIQGHTGIEHRATCIYKKSENIFIPGNYVVRGDRANGTDVVRKVIAGNSTFGSSTTFNGLLVYKGEETVDTPMESRHCIRSSYRLCTDFHVHYNIPEESS
jgi:hypothetical protein